MKGSIRGWELVLITADETCCARSIVGWESNGTGYGSGNKMKIHLSLLGSSLSYLDSVAVRYFFESESL